MEELIFTKRYEQMTTCSGSLLMPLPRLSGIRKEREALVWRARLFENRSTECAIFVLEFKSKYFLKACDVGTKAKVRMNLAISQIKTYTIINCYWHEIELQDERKFALRLDGADDLEKFIDSLKRVMKPGKVLFELKGQEGDKLLSGMHLGPPINSAEASKRKLSECIIAEQGLPTRHEKISNAASLLDSTSLKNRPLPPIPDTELEDSMKPRDRRGSVGDLLESFSTPFFYGPCSEVDEEALDQLTDESLMLEEAIQRGDPDEAAHWAALLAKRKSDVVITYVSTVEDPLLYRRLARYQQSSAAHQKPVEDQGYVCMVNRKTLSPDTQVHDNPPPLPKRPQTTMQSKSNALPKPGRQQLAPSPTPKPRPRTTLPKTMPDQDKKPEHNYMKLMPDSGDKVERSYTGLPDRGTTTKAELQRQETWACWNCSATNEITAKFCNLCNEGKP